MSVCIKFLTLFKGLGFIFAFWVCGCLYTSHNYNNGKVLEGGASAVTLGYGTQDVMEPKCLVDDQWGYGSQEGNGEGLTCQYIRFTDNINPDTLYRDPNVKTTGILDISLGYKLGLLNAFGPFTGLEFGYQIQIPSLPASVEFYLKAGLPITLKYHHHSASMGYIIGTWSDNSYFLEYAHGRELANHIMYGSFRSTWMGTQLNDLGDDVGDDLDYAFPHRRRWVHQLNLGAHFNLPAWKVLPDFLSPQINFIYPDIPLVFNENALGYPRNLFYIKWNIGLGWNY